MKLRPGYVAITPDMRALIKGEIERTGIAPQKLLKGNAEAKKIGLTSGIIYAFAGINKPVKSGRKEHVDFALGLWRDVPDGMKKEHFNRYKSTKNGYQPISAEDRARLKKIQDLTGLLPGRIFKLSDHIPPYLNKNIVGQWLTQSNYSADPKDVKWVLDTCEGILKETLELYK